MTRAYAMTLDEAMRIRQQSRRGALDLSLPGTHAVVLRAERTCERADLWGYTRRDRIRSRLPKGPQDPSTRPAHHARRNLVNGRANDDSHDDRRRVDQREGP